MQLFPTLCLLKIWSKFQLLSLRSSSQIEARAFFKVRRSELVGFDCDELPDPSDVYCCDPPAGALTTPDFVECDPLGSGKIVEGSCVNNDPCVDDPSTGQATCRRL
jgi:hypothetical protein